MTRPAVTERSPAPQNMSTLLERATALRDEQRALDAQAEKIRRQREQLATELAEVEGLIAMADQSEGTSSAAKRARHEERPSTLAPKSWKMLDEVVAHVSAQRAAGKLLPFGAPGRVPRVYVDGCFDMMHSGHMNAVRQAKLIADSVGGLLIVGVHTDVEIEKNKGPPVMHDAERLALVSAVKWVDELVFDTPYTMSLPFLDSIDADYVVHGDDISINADGTDAYAAARQAGRMKVVKRTEGVSTTDLVGRLLLLTKSHQEPAPPVPEVVTDATPSSAADAASVYTGANISSSGVSQFLPTTWRLRQFSNGRVAQPGASVVYVDGAFDLLHAGHVDSLYAARNKGDFLLVGLHDDATVNQQRGQNQPICSLHERALCVLALACVDEVILGAPSIVSNDLIKSMNISIVVKDADDVSDGTNSNSTTTSPIKQAASPLKALASPGAVTAVDRYAVPRELGILHETPQATKHPLHLGDIVTRIIENRTRYEARNLKREKRELNYMQNQKTFIAEI